MNNNFYKSYSKVRKEMASKSLKIFATTYFKHYTKMPFAQFHLELFDYFQAMTFNRNKRFAVAAPRGYAKSSIISLIYPLWCICFGYENFIVLSSSTERLSEKLLSHIKDELSGNVELRQDFPDVCEPPNFRWCRNEIITKNKASIAVTSVGKKIRGMRHKEQRPGLIILDDVENHEGVRTAEGREKMIDWLTKVIMSLGHEKTNFIVAGTILHFDSLLAKLTASEDFAGWDTQIYKAIQQFPDHQVLWDQWAQIYRNKQFHEGKTGPNAAEKFFTGNVKTMLQGSVVLWEEKESFLDLMLIREQRGEAAFSSEKMNEPKMLETIDMKMLDYWDNTGISSNDFLNSLKNKIMAGACDPAFSLKPRSDYSAIVTAAFDKENKVVYVVGAEAGRWGIDDLVKRISVLYQIMKYAKFIYESNAAQVLLGSEIKKQCPMLPLQPIVSIEPKDVRIMRLRLLIKQGTVKLSKKLTELNRQIEQYPFCAHDDLIDALSMLVEKGNFFSEKWIPEKAIEVLKSIENPYWRKEEEIGPERKKFEEFFRRLHPR